MKSEFTVSGAYQYNHSSTTRWLLSHVRRHWVYAVITVISATANSAGQVGVAYLIGDVFNTISNGGALADIRQEVFIIFCLGVLYGSSQWIRNFSMEILAQRVEREAREELYISLLSKSQTFHDRQRVGDIMARATDDVRQMNFMLNPGMMLLIGSGVFLFVPLFGIVALDVRLLLTPILFVTAFIISLWDYVRRLRPVATQSRESFGVMNAGLQEAISGIETVKASATERDEQQKFIANAAEYRKWFVKQGNLEAIYIPLLLLSVGITLGFLHAVLMYQAGQIPLGSVVSFVGMFMLFRFPTFISIFTFSMVQIGYAGARRILELMNDETDLDENPKGFRDRMEGAITFQNVSFGYSGSQKAVIQDVSFEVKPGQTVAIVGQTGSGKSTLTKLVNRIYDVDSGRVLIDGIDVREWSLDSLRSQISTIEQDIFLFSRSLGENIAFGLPAAESEKIERASRDSQAYDFIQHFADGFDTEVGERGVTLSGGQRQRIALARAFLTDPRILVLDDSTSAIDSATEDEIQKAIRRAQEGRTVLLITHRLSQIRWADLILVMKQGRIVAQGTHESLLTTSDDYRRIFARYDIEIAETNTEATAS